MTVVVVSRRSLLSKAPSSTFLLKSNEKENNELLLRALRRNQAPKENDFLVVQYQGYVKARSNRRPSILILFCRTVTRELTRVVSREIWQQQKQPKNTRQWR